jgi:bifunctional DNase/RNase
VTEIGNRHSVRENGYCTAHGQHAAESYLSHHRQVGHALTTTAENDVFCDLVLAVFDYAANHQWVYLQEHPGARILVLDIGYYEATTLYHAIHHRSFSRPITHPAMVSLISALGGEVQDIIIDRFNEQDKYYSATVRIRQGDRTVAVDFRPSDAICLALYAQVPMFMAKAVRDQLPERASAHS